MDKLVDFSKYKNNQKAQREAKVLLPHLNSILHVVNLNIKGLTLYKSYIPVAKILQVLNEQKTILEIHQKRFVEIVNNKGK